MSEMMNGTPLDDDEMMDVNGGTYNFTKNRVSNLTCDMTNGRPRAKRTIQKEDGTKKSKVIMTRTGTEKPEGSYDVSGGSWDTDTNITMGSC